MVNWTVVNKGRAIRRNYTNNLCIKTNFNMEPPFKTNNIYCNLNDEISCINTETPTKTNTSSTTVIVGDTSIRNLAKEIISRNKDYSVYCFRKASIEDVTKEIERLSVNKQALMPKLLIASAGEANVLRNEANKNILERYQRIIETMRNKAEVCVLMGILPKSGKYDYFNGKAYIINTKLMEICNQNDVIFLNLWDYFKNKCQLYVINGKLLSAAGISRLGRLLDAQISMILSQLNQITNILQQQKSILQSPNEEESNLADHGCNNDQINFKFTPLLSNVRHIICERFNYVLSNIAIQYIASDERGEPSRLYETSSDGNCLFRAISYGVSGSQTNHLKVREQIVNFLRTNEALFMPIIVGDYGNQIDRYIQAEEMDKVGVWGTQTEIFAAAKLYNINIHIYMPHLDRPIWQSFRPDFLAPTNEAPIGELYLNNTNGNHFDVVLETKRELQINNKLAKISRFYNDSKNVINRTVTTVEQSMFAPRKSNQVEGNTVKKTCKLEGRNSLKCFYSNARSIVNKFNELKAINDLENFDIIGISESWVNQKRHFISEYNLPGYKLFNYDRSLRNEANSKKRGGGVMLYVKDAINAVQIFSKEDPNVESLWVKIKQNRKSVLVGIAYRSPTNDTECDHLLFNQIEKVCNTGDAVVLMGDFNYRNINWGHQTCGKASEQFMEVVQNCYLFQKVDEPTRGENILDLVLCNEENIVQTVKVGESLGDSDHQIIRFNIKIETTQTKSTMLVPNFRKANFNEMRDGLAGKCWEKELDSNTVNEMWEKLQHILKLQINKHIPFVEKRNVQCYNKWLNKDLKNLVKAKKCAFNHLKRTQSDDAAQTYRDLRRKLKRDIKRSKKSYEEQIAKNCKNNPKELFKYVKAKKIVKETMGPIKNSSGKLAHDTKDMVEILNDTFIKVFTNEDLGAIPTPAKMFHGDETEELNNLTVSKYEVEAEIKKLNIYKAMGPDEIHPRVIKELKDQLTEPLTILFNKSLEDGTVPDEWKKANISPLFKKGDKTNPENYRPISLTSVICKILESIIRDKLVTHLEKNFLLNNSQHGFRKGRNCVTNLLEFYNKVMTLHDNGEPTDIIYLDFKKAFDKVPHKRLLSKINAHGITGKVARWIENWLSNRQQRVTVDGIASEWKGVLSGVPQGSVLGPILFNLYINDIDSDIKSEISKFADDTKLSGKANSQEDTHIIQNDLNSISKWGRKWQMEFNTEKCKVLHIGRSNSKNEYTLNGIKINTTLCEKDLGVTFTKDLKSSKHCNEAASKANRMLGFLLRSFEYKSPQILLPLFNAYVRPLMEYGAPLWSPYQAKDKLIMERIQRRFTKYFPGLRNKPYEERLKCLNLYSTEKRRLRGDLIQVFKLLNGMYDVQESSYFQRTEELRTRSNGFKLRGKQYKTSIAGNFFTNRVVEGWNKLPAWVVESTDVKMFKSKLDKYFIANNIF